MVESLDNMADSGLDACFEQNGARNRYLQGWYGELSPDVCMAPEHYCRRVAEFEAQPVCENAVVLLGDSLTEFADWNHLLHGTFGRPASGSGCGSGLSYGVSGESVPILNRGIAGDMIEGMVLRLDELVRHAPSKIFLMAGCNNFVKHPSITVAQVWSAYRKLIAQLRMLMPSAGLFVASTLPLNHISGDYYEGINRKIAALNTLLKNHSSLKESADGSPCGGACGVGYAADKGCNEVYCAQPGCFDSSDEQRGCVGCGEYLFYDVVHELSDFSGFLRADLTIDGCHLNDAGYRIWASRILSL